jgi:hypothetical protein
MVIPEHGPVLYKEIVDGNEDPMEQFIQNGSARARI